METPKNPIPLSFSKERALLSQEKVLLYFIFHLYELVWFLQWQKAQKIAKKKSFDHGKLSCIAHLKASQGPPPLLTPVECSIVAAGLRNPTQMASKANSLVFRFLLQSFKGWFADQRSPGKKQKTQVIWNTILVGISHCGVPFLRQLLPPGVALGMRTKRGGSGGWTKPPKSQGKNEEEKRKD